ncbi:uncharacterized protein KLLA0_A10351g [Kluyveromyces lactis]|uniref:KLLA0A10351p n=1 Tax=Kluyveromyces lactis (strain ATCC 8585 / CBS 2359 / DSM 70799 / NBRC 1267 / NRRL Y-1140 / WM37) TaxID=284590 RepID=Q6CX86_KLULA|nr:uncharacterized protein KLLA0_A10351g [Kluyveromyces lactis]CAH03041.1 KLLA0A10351p [Kluyveromyces lactis]|eukprot:XP_451453.1 uncharacterized protein KLLA0_A10351g [Kluyveromyces lactis]
MSFKFDDNGVVKTFHGNTIICHIPQQTDFFNRLLDFYRFAKRLSFYDKITLLPPSSYHVTIMNCCHEHDRSVGHWPTGLGADASISECHNHLAQLFKDANFRDQGTNPSGVELKVHIPPKDELPSSKPRSINVIVKPSNTSQETAIKQLRDSISALTGLEDPSHDSIKFHITLAYINEELKDSEVEELNSHLGNLHCILDRDCPVVQLGEPEFVTFEDMFYFHLVTKL